MPKIDDLFKVVKGNGGYIRDFDEGTTPLVSATNLSNGITNFVNDMPKFKAPAITVERVTGSAFVQLVDFSTVPDDLSVLIPKQHMELKKLYIVASIINNSKWRFSYARKLTPTRLKNMIVPDLEGKSLRLASLSSIQPRFRGKKKSAPKDTPKFKKFYITQLFHPARGDFHALSKLNVGDIPTVSRVSYDCGIAGYYAKPPKAKLYPPLTITVSTVTGDAFVQLQSFIATDNVLVLLTKRKYDITTLLFIQAMLNRERWRCAYGRQLYKERFRRTQIYLPVNSDEQIDEDYMRKIIQSTQYWKYLESYMKSSL